MERGLGVERKLINRWYVLSSKLNKEEILLRQLQSQGYEVFYPRYFTANGNTGRLQIRSYFPGYLFIRLDLTSVNQSTFQWMPNSEGLVCFEAHPAYVPDTLVEAIIKHVEKLNQARLTDLVNNSELDEVSGQRSGLSTHYDAIFNAGLSGDERVKELLRMLEW